MIKGGVSFVISVVSSGNHIHLEIYLFNLMIHAYIGFKVLLAVYPFHILIASSCTFEFNFLSKIYQLLHLHFYLTDCYPCKHEIKRFCLLNYFMVNCTVRHFLFKKEKEIQNYWKCFTIVILLMYY